MKKLVETKKFRRLKSKQKLFSHNFINNNIMQGQSARNKTTIMHNQDNKKKRMKSLSIKPAKTMNYRPNNAQHKQIRVVNAKQQNYTKFQNRSSLKLCLSSYKLKVKHTSHFQSLQSEAKNYLESLTLKQKILQIQNIIRKSLQLCRMYGYFSLTFAMIKFVRNQEYKISIWMHPDRRCTKPLHPIKRSTQFQCELACVADIKQILKILFPTVDLGDNKTFATIKAQVDALKGHLDHRFRNIKCSKQNQQQAKSSLTKNTNPRKNIQSNMVQSPRKIKFNNYKITDHNQEESSQKLKINKDSKQTASTLVDTINSGYSINFRQKLKKQLVFQHHKTKQDFEVKKKQLKQSLSMPIAEIKDVFANDQKSQIKSHKPIQISALHPSSKLLNKMNLQRNEKKQNIAMNTSAISRRLMTMSTQIQGQINNLFGDDVHLNTFYQRNCEVKVMKNSILSKVAEQFQDLF